MDMVGGLAHVLEDREVQQINLTRRQAEVVLAALRIAARSHRGTVQSSAALADGPAGAHIRTSTGGPLTSLQHSERTRR